MRRRRSIHRALCRLPPPFARTSRLLEWLEFERSQAAATSGRPPLRRAAGKTIGVSIQNREAQFYQDMEAGMQAQAAKYGYKLIVVDANRDNAKQQSQVEDFISKKVDAIVLTPYDSQAIGSAIVEANNASIPVFTADIASASSQGKVVAHIASDNVQGGAASRHADVPSGRQERQRRDHRRAGSDQRARSRQRLQTGARAATVPA